MRVLITTQVFPPEFHPTAVMAHELACGLAQRGCAVTVAAGLPHAPTGRLYEGHGGELRRVDERDGYRVIRVWHPTTPRRTIPARLGVMLTQMFATTLAAVSGGRPDVVLSFGGPPLVGPVLSGLLARMWRVPLVTVVHDLYPDVAIEAGAVRSKLFIAAARLFENLQHRLSSRLVVLGEATRAVLVHEKGVAAERIEVLPVWLDPNEIVPGLADNDWRRDNGIRPDDFVVLYSGTSGIISGAEMLAEVAARLPRDVLIVLVGGGTAWNALAKLRDEGRTPPNLRLLPYQPRERLGEVQAASNLSLLTLLPGRGRTSVPSKLQGYMAAGRPVVAAVDADCDTARLIEREQFGRVVRPVDPAALAEAILELRGAPEQLAAWGTRARHAFEREHAREPLIARYVDLLRQEAVTAFPALSPGPE